METPFNMIICGMTNCGKTYHFLNMIEKHYRKHFDYFILICPTFTCNKTYQEWKYINDPDLLLKNVIKIKSTEYYTLFRKSIKVLII